MRQLQASLKCGRGVASAVAMAFLLTGGGAAGVGASPATEFTAPFLAYEVPTGGSMVRLADMTHGARPDIVVRTTSTVSILPIQADGRPGVRIDLGFGGTAPVEFVVADFNEDGWNDLVAGSGVRLSDGAGGFVVGTSLSATGTSLWAGPVTEDGHADVAAVIGSNVLGFWPGNGNGTFGARVDTPLPYTALVGAAGRRFADFNGDGHVDFVYVGVVSSTLHLVNLLGDGAGAFTTVADQVVTLGGFAGLTPGRIDGDASLDLLALDGGEFLHGNGDGSFAPPVSTGIARPRVVADFDGDGVSDAASGTACYPGNGDGTFDAAAVLTLGLTSSDVVAGDVDGDGHADLVATSSGRAVLVGYGNGDFTFGVSHTMLITSGSWTEAAAGDLNGDGRADLVVGGYAIASGKALAVLLGDGNGGFTTAQEIPGALSLTEVAIADLDGDGHLDVVATDEIGLQVDVWAGNGDGTLQPAVSFATLSGPRDLAITDLNADGRLDVVVCGVTPVSRSPAVEVHIRNPGGTYTGYVTTYSGSAQFEDLAVGDLNGDGRLDVMVLDINSGSLALRMFRGTGNAVSPLSYQTSSPLLGQPVRVRLADMDEDGRVDPVVLNAATGIPAFATAVEWRRNLGGFSFDLPTYAGVLTTTQPTSPEMAVADFDQDGHLDVVTTGTPAVSLLKGDGAGGLLDPWHYGASFTPRAVVAADLSGDGRPDIAAVTAGGGVNAFLQATPISGVGEFPARPELVARLYPNPTAGSVTVEFRVPRAAPVSVAVYDVQGRRVRQLLEGFAESGERRLRWTGRDELGQSVPNGVYFVRIAAGDLVSSRRVVLRR